jgi:hypothetical protein
VPHMLPDEIRRYEDSGLLLIPCKPDKTPAYKGWQQIASSQRQTHQRWFLQLGHQVGILTGCRNGLVYLDFDDRSAAREFFNQFRSRIRAIVETPHGCHFPFRHPGGTIPNAVKTRIGNLLADIRGDGGYVIAPPSRINGNPYRFVEGYELEPKRLELFSPAWLRPERSSARIVRGQVHDPAAYIAHIRAISGQRGHDATFRAACILRDNQIDETEALAILVEWNKTNAQPPWATRDLFRKVKEAYRLPSTDG